MSKKQFHGWQEGTDGLDTSVRLKQDEERRDRRWCFHYDNKNKKCRYRNGECIGSSHCPDYKEDTSKKKKKKTANSTRTSHTKAKTSTGSSIAISSQQKRNIFEHALREAKLNNIDYMYLVAQYYKFGQGVTQDYTSAMSWYKKAFQQNHKYGAVDIGDLYEKGLGTEKDLHKALEWYEKGAAVNESGAKERAARLKKVLSASAPSPAAVPKTPQPVVPPKEKHAPVMDPWLLGKEAYQKQQWLTAYQYLAQAAKSGNVEAICMLADMYYEGIGGQRKDYQRAFQYYHQAAKQNNVHAMHRLGLMYMQGEGIAKSSQYATTWLRRAWENGDQTAKVDYDCMLNLNGDNDTEAIKLPQTQDTVVSRNTVSHKEAIYDRPIKPQYGTKSNRNQALVFSLILIAIALVFGFIVWNQTSTKPLQSPKTGQPQSHFVNKKAFGTPDNPYILTAEELMARYNDNPEEAERNYKGKYIKLTGTVIHIGKFNDSDHLALLVYSWKYGGNQYKVLGDISPQNKSWIDNLHTGDSVTLMGRFKGAVKQKSDNVLSLQLAVTKMAEK